MFWRAIREEFHTQRFVFFLGLALAVIVYALLHIGPWRKPDLNYNSFHLVGSLICMVFASCAGSLALDRNNHDSRISISRFLLKLVVGAFSTTIAGMSVVVALALSVQQHSSDTTLDSLLGSLYPDFSYLPPLLPYFSGSFVVFACSVLFSLLLSRRWLSVLTGFVIGIAVLVATAFFWLRLDFAPWEEGHSIFYAMLLNGALLTFYVQLFLRRWSRRSSSIRFVFVFCAILSTVFGASALIFFMQPLPGPLDLWKPCLSPTGSEVVGYASGSSNRQIWTIPTEPGRGKRIFKRHAYDADVSPDGRRISFLSQEGIFGLRSFFVDLRTATIDGTKETILLRKFARWFDDEVGIGFNGKAFSPDSNHIALLSVTALYVLDLEGNTISRASIPTESVTRLLGWRPDNSAVLILDFDRKCIEAYDLSSRQFRTVYRISQDPQLWVPIDSYTGIRFVLFGNELVDLDNGSVQLLPGDIHFPDISIDHKNLSYSFSTDFHNEENSFAKVYHFSIRTGQDELIGEFKGAAAHLVISPDGSRTAIELRTGFNQLQTVVMNGNSLARKFEGWGVVGWRDANRVVLTNDRFATKRMALGDIDTGQIHQFYP